MKLIFASPTPKIGLSMTFINNFVRVFICSAYICEKFQKNVLTLSDFTWSGSVKKTSLILYYIIYEKFKQNWYHHNIIRTRKVSLHKAQALSLPSLMLTLFCVIIQFLKKMYYFKKKWKITRILLFFTAQFKYFLKTADRFQDPPHIRHFFPFSRAFPAVAGDVRKLLV